MSSSTERKKVTVGVSGGIAAYKAAELVRELQQHGAEVRVVMTRAAQEFIQPLTFSSLTGHKVGAIDIGGGHPPLLGLPADRSQCVRMIAVAMSNNPNFCRRDRSNGSGIGRQLGLP